MLGMWEYLPVEMAVKAAIATPPPRFLIKDDTGALEAWDSSSEEPVKITGANNGMPGSARGMAMRGEASAKIVRARE